MSIDLSELLSIRDAVRRTPLSEPALRNRISRDEIQCVRIAWHVFDTETELRLKLGDLYQPV